MPGSDLTRKKIRDNVKSLLVAGVTGAGANVFISRINKTFIEELPGIFIYTTNDNPVHTRHFENTYDRTVTLVTEVIVAQKKDTDIIQDIADTIAGEIEDILLPNVFLQDPAPFVFGAAKGPKIISYIELGPTNLSRVDELQEDLFGIIIEFECGYHYEHFVPSSLLTDPFNKFEEKFEIGDDDEEALRLVNIPTP